MPKAVQTPRLGDSTLTFTDQQEQAIAGLRAAFRAPDKTVATLDGITGSGKTEVYFELMNDVLEAGRQVLVLVPEIALTEGWVSRFKKRFGVEPGFWHSNVPPHRKARFWRGVAAGEVPVVVGARSALGLPFPDLGLIVVDEEHDGSFKQQDGLLYHARDAAVVLATCCDAKVILASATPSLETVRNGREGNTLGLRCVAGLVKACCPPLRLSIYARIALNRTIGSRPRLLPRWRKRLAKASSRWFF